MRNLMDASIIIIRRGEDSEPNFRKFDRQIAVSCDTAIKNQGLSGG